MEEVHRIKSYIPSKQFALCLDNFRQYVLTQPSDDLFKKEALNNHFLEINPAYYLGYPYLFAAAFEYDHDNLSKLSTAGFFLFKYVMTSDKILDERQFDPKDVFFSSYYLEGSMKILSRLFQDESKFWNVFNKRKQEYMLAYKMDTSNKLSYSEYESYADFKSTFGKLAIDALYFVSNSEKELLYEDLLKSHKLFSVGVQLYDDIIDLREDFSSGQFNMAYQELCEELKRRDLTPSDYSVEDLSRQLYIFGVSSRLFEKSLDYLLLAEEIALKSNAPEWTHVIRERYNSILIKKLDSQAYVEHIKTNLSFKKETKLSNLSLSKSLNYLVINQEKNGCWKDFYNGAGLSDSWVTGFVMSNLSQQEILNSLPEEVICKAYEFLSNDVIWGYNCNWIPDADSSTFALLAKFFHTGTINQESFNLWTKFQNKDGGFGTYSDEMSVRSSICLNDGEVTGWINSHICVSAAALFYLCKSKHDRVIQNKLESYLLNSISQEGIWESYWWTSPIYSTTYLIKSLNGILNDSLRDKVEKAIPIILDQQNINGSFGDVYFEETSFYTALVLDALCEDERVFRRFELSAKKAYEWLISSQLSNGTWSTLPVMRIPDTDITDPKKVELWTVGNLGNNIQVTDFKRIFTTSLVVASLVKYSRMPHGNK